MQQDIPGLGIFLTRDQAQKRALAGAVRTDNGVKPPFGKRKGYAVDSVNSAIGLFQIPHLERKRRSRSGGGGVDG
jgi:hypothetical protein